jgi:hypothetical protein
MCVKKDFNQCQQRWWKIFELTTANPLFLNILPKLSQRLVLPEEIKIANFKNVVLN